MATADIDGSNRVDRFITSAIGVQGVAVDAEHVYWGTTIAPYTIARADIDGSNPDLSFIGPLGNGHVPEDLAVDANHIYWIDLSGAIGRADLDGSNAGLFVITASGSFNLSPVVQSVPGWLAVDSEHIYWTESLLRNANGEIIQTIGRANLD